MGCELVVNTFSCLDNITWWGLLLTIAAVVTFTGWISLLWRMLNE